MLEGRVLAEQKYTHNVSANLRSLVKVIFVSDVGKRHEGPKTFRLPHFKVIARGRDGQCTNEQFQFANWASAVRKLEVTLRYVEVSFLQFA